MYTLIGVALIAFTYFISEWFKYKEKLRIFYSVKSIETHDSSFLLEMLCEFYNSDNIPPECVIGFAKERKLAISIIDDFKKDLTSLFSKEMIPLVIKKKSNKISNYLFVNFRLSDIDFFAHYLCSYLKNKNEIGYGINYEDQQEEHLSIVFYKLLLISYIHSNNLNISGYTESEAERILLDIKWKREHFMRHDLHGHFVPYTGNDPDLGEITRDYIEARSFELGLFSEEVLQMINQKRIDAKVRPIYEDEII